MTPAGERLQGSRQPMRKRFGCHAPILGFANGRSDDGPGRKRTVQIRHARERSGPALAKSVPAPRQHTSPSRCLGGAELSCRRFSLSDAADFRQNAFMGGGSTSSLELVALG